MDIEQINEEEVEKIFVSIKELVVNSRSRVYKTVNVEMLSLYWNIGKIIVIKQCGEIRVKYGNLLIDGLSKKLTEHFGKVFSIQNLRRMR